jgi:hypothetical protein
MRFQTEQGHEIELGWDYDTFAAWHMCVFGTQASQYDYQQRYTTLVPGSYEGRRTNFYPTAAMTPAQTASLKALHSKRCACEYCAIVRGLHRLPAPVEDMIQHNFRVTDLSFTALSAADKQHITAGNKHTKHTLVSTSLEMKCDLYCDAVHGVLLRDTTHAHTVSHTGQLEI